MRDGYGRCMWADGTFYEGFWHNDNLDGFGIINISNGSVYEGEFV